MRKYRRRLAALCLALLVAASMTACGKENGDGGLTEVTVCLDWTPNTNHTGLYAALALGYFEEAGLKVNIAQPPEDGAAALCAAGQAEFAVAVQDNLAAAFARENPLGITAVAALLQHNTSGIISRAGEGLDRPRGLEGRRYSTYNGVIELAIMEQVVESDGGDFSKVELLPYIQEDEAGALREELTDAIWVYYGWGGIAAKQAGLEFDYFYLKDIDPVFDYYTPVLVANNDFLEEQPETARAFLAAAAKGYAYAIENPVQAARLLVAGDDTGALAGSEALVTASQEWISTQYRADAERWGYIDPARWNAFYNWLNENGLVEREIPENTGFSNDYLPQ